MKIEHEYVRYKTLRTKNKKLIWIIIKYVYKIQLYLWLTWFVTVGGDMRIKKKSRKKIEIISYTLTIFLL